MEEIIITNEGYRKHGREVTEKNSNSLTTTQKSTPSRTKYSHTVYTSVKIKRNIPTIRMSILETQEIPQSMDIDELIEEPSWYSQILLETREIVEALITKELEIFEEEYVTLHHEAYNRESKKKCYWKKSIQKIKIHHKYGNHQLILMGLLHRKLHNSTAQLKNI